MHRKGTFLMPLILPSLRGLPGWHLLWYFLLVFPRDLLSSFLQSSLWYQFVISINLSHVSSYIRCQVVYGTASVPKINSFFFHSRTLQYTFSFYLLSYIFIADSQGFSPILCWIMRFWFLKEKTGPRFLNHHWLKDASSIPLFSKPFLMWRRFPVESGFIYHKLKV